MAVLEALTKAGVLFWAKVDVRGQDECWPYMAAKRRHNYGVYAVRVDGKVKAFGAHAVAWMLANGRLVPTGLQINHRCGRPSCCNPKHVYAGTQSDNMLDASRGGTLKRARNTSAAKLDEARVVEIRRRLSDGERVKILAAEFDVTQAAIYNIRNLKSWAHVVDGA